MSITELTKTESDQFITLLQNRFEQNMHRHKDIKWTTVLDKLQANPEKLYTIMQMENTEGEPDIIILKDNILTYIDCSIESPKGRRSLCYDKSAWDSRKENKPPGNAVDMASTLGIEILNQEQYQQLQEFDDFDLKTSSWLLTPEGIRTKKGAIFGDKRYGHTFIYHNGAESYYAARGFRGMVIL